ncbi:MAG: phosphoribosylglycinamide formyltransferase [Alphaproteobacteria bacterium]|nr:MAG: phosphoribosylglycinamide formyltransferase [Alphaproteobacteria bacterium]
MKIGFLASHGGSNMQAIIDACSAGTLDAVPAVVISNNGDSQALARAQTEGIPNCHLSAKVIPDGADLDQMILDALLDHNTDVVVLAGYMRKIGPKVLGHFKGRILNIHPALLPKFGGQGMYGMKVHRAVVEAGETESGVTIHLVDADYDTGPILAQASVSLALGDTPEDVAAKVLKIEHRFFSETLQRIVQGDIKLPD